MVQVYALITDGERVLIPKKAETNNRWNGVETNIHSVVNQAGQYALFGGKKEATESILDTAKRELKEESGVNINNFSHVCSEERMERNYSYVSIELNREDFETVANLAKDNIKRRNVKDSEMQSVIIVPKESIGAYLGVRQSISRRTSDRIAQEIANEKSSLAKKGSSWRIKDAMCRNHQRHEIDWYEKIAEHVLNTDLKKERTSSLTSLESFISSESSSLFTPIRKFSSFSNISTPDISTPSQVQASSPEETLPISSSTASNHSSVSSSPSTDKYLTPRSVSSISPTEHSLKDERNMREFIKSLRELKAFEAYNHSENNFSSTPSPSNKPRDTKKHI